MSVEGPSRLPTRRKAQRMSPAATAQARSVSRSPGTTGPAGVSVRAVTEDGRHPRSERHTDPPVRHLPQSPTDKAVANKRRSAMVCWRAVPLRPCIVSFKDMRGIRHATEVEAESLFEAAVLGVRRLREDPWLEKIGLTTVLDVQVRNPGTTHALSLQQVERWLGSPTTRPSEG